MDQKFLQLLQHRAKLPKIIRYILGGIYIFASLFPIILPLFPGSIFPGIMIFLFGVGYMVSTKNLKNIIKIKKALFYMAKNISNKHILKQKYKDLKKIFRDIKKTDSY